MLLLLLACSEAPDPRALHAEALSRIEEAPAEAAAICPKIQDADLRADCAWAIAGELGAEDTALAETVCGGLSGLGADECWFIYAEATLQTPICARAGTFKEDCAVHLLRLSSSEWMPKGSRPGDFEAEAARRIEEAGLYKDLPSAWSVLYNELFRRQKPFDPGSCVGAPDPTRRALCEKNARRFFDRRLTQLHQRGVALCKDPLPKTLRYVPDPAIDALLAERRATDLCAPPEPGARRRR